MHTQPNCVRQTTSKPAKADVWVVMCRMWLRASQKRRTTTQPEGKEATWHESFKLPVHIPEAQKLEMVLFDHDNIGSDDELGR